SSNCILFQNATPVFADIDPLTLNIDPEKIEAKITPRTKGILPVHVFGHPANMEEINKIALKYNLFVIEDACEAIGAKYRGQNAGTFGDGAVFAFYPNKQITTGEGGIIVTNNEETARLCKSMRNQGRSEGTAWLEHERLGFNYRMDELSAALGLVQINRLDEILAKRNQVAEIYKKKLSRIPEITPPFVAPDINMSWFVFVIRLPIKINRDKVMKYLLNQGIQCRPYFTPIHLQPFYREMFGFQPGDFPITEEVSNTTLALPFYNNLTDEEIDYVLNHLEKAISHQ
ncbi:MAG: DegT/DnrJ/EryC1/StrS family aminotransferase, partial [Desulfitobacteriaceae bacterium]|nr:DegT/DnrJ/EryC1/StrS family aminotransferase [Desulfitobacteriaceae bacterium]